MFHAVTMVSSRLQSVATVLWLHSVPHHSAGNGRDRPGGDAVHPARHPRQHPRLLPALGAGKQVSRELARAALRHAERERADPAGQLPGPGPVAGPLSIRSALLGAGLKLLARVGLEHRVDPCSINTLTPPSL